jgi:hypothetical protein
MLELLRLYPYFLDSHLCYINSQSRNLTYRGGGERFEKDRVTKADLLAVILCGHCARNRHRQAF